MADCNPEVKMTFERKELATMSNSDMILPTSGTQNSGQETGSGNNCRVISTSGFRYRNFGFMMSADVGQCRRWHV